MKRFGNLEWWQDSKNAYVNSDGTSSFGGKMIFRGPGSDGVDFSSIQNAGTYGDLIADSNWHTRDLSSIVPVLTSWILININVLSSSQPDGSFIAFRRTGDTGSICGFNSQVVNITNSQQIWVPLTPEVPSTQQEIDYVCGDDSGNGSVSITIICWVV